MLPWSTSLPSSPRRRLELLAAGCLSVALAGLIALVDNLARREPPLLSAAPVPIAVFPDFASIGDIDVKKQQFFDYLQDYIVAENRAIAALREELATYVEVANDGFAFSRRERERVLQLAKNYRVDASGPDYRKMVNELWLRVDGLPVALALAQAANESAWGASRFAVLGNNVFGQWCYEEGCGIVPRQRHDDAFHEVQSFASLTAGVRSYFLNINTHPSYSYLRELRAEMREHNQQLDALVLAYGLGRYSERRERYVDEIQDIILHNDLLQRDRRAPSDQGKL